MTHSTKGIVLRSIKYGETSLVVTMFTELFGIQTYLVQGARSAKKTGTKAAMLQPAALLDLEVYHNELKSLQRIKDCQWSILYQHILSDVVKNNIALFMVELLTKTLKQPEKHADLFYFCEASLMQLDAANKSIAANFPLFFALQLPQFFGFTISHPLPGESNPNHYLDLVEGNFVSKQPTHPFFLAPELAAITAELLLVMHPSDLDQVKLNQISRRALLVKYLEYYRLHLPEFGNMRTLEVIQEVMG